MLKRLAALVLLAGASLAAPSVATAQLTVRYGDSALAAATFGVLTHPGSASGANTGCKPNAKHPVPVILVHATFASSAATSWSCRRSGADAAALIGNGGHAGGSPQENLIIDRYKQKTSGQIGLLQPSQPTNYQG